MAITGIGSGMDVNGMVKALLNAEAAPKTAQLDRLEKSTTSKVSALGQFRSALSTFQDALGKLNDASLFEKRSATSSAAGIVSITADSRAVAGNYNVQVFNLAQTSKVALAGFDNASDALGTGTLTINVGDESLDIDVGEGNNSLTGIRDAINAAGKEMGLSATIVNDPSGEGGARLVLSSTASGTDNDISVAVSDATGELGALAFAPPSGTDADFQPTPVDADNPRAARVISYSRDANFAIDGINLSSASNTVEDAIEGVTLTLKAAQSQEALDNAETVNLGVAVDQAGVKKSITEFVDAYNKMLDSVNALTNVTPIADGDSEPLTAALVGDSSVRSFMNAMRSELGSPASGEGIRILADLGISTERDGKLKLDNDKLDKALDNNLEQVSSFFTGEQGLMGRLEERVKPFTESGGILDNRTKALQNTLTGPGGVDDQRETLAMRLSKMETRLFAQFNAMDALISQMNSTSSFLTAQLDSLPGVVNQNKK
ncbi:flagellar filament capping protein FliD [Halopseudomonas bauzanensis]|uniref:Flagellar hook-associated protein 2 n=1 Tax=Halopseudomonas bauzanensis TaxID=653930 RepID=A0A1H9QCS9_9GAMM|nr:flagellar filament capping protein FliD [Halopseudomonas bauzanensis]SER58212.1 flagellar hook-associated protein 2 [Halopseudomonas bauzanensis]SFL67258.1 flagellar hook-associated protein 2 [Halopseudomonas bauzanensis]